MCINFEFDSRGSVWRLI